jgi:peptidyl-prolyl cis-trans isomerase-like protein 2
MPSSDKLHVTASEHAAGAGGYKAPVAHEHSRLPFTHCALTLAPWGASPCAATAASTGHAYLFDLLALVPYLRRHARHPITGDALASKDILRLKFARNGEGALACAATGKVLGEHTKVAALRTTGNVYSYDALQTLCFAPRNFTDLLDGTPFVRATDVVLLQDPGDPAWLHAHRTSHIRGARELHGGGGGGAGAGAGSGEVANSGGGVIRLSEVARSVLAELPKGEAAAAAAAAAAAGALEGAGAAAAAAAAASGKAHVSGFGVKTTHHAAASLTSTAVTLSTRNLAAVETAAERSAARWARIAALGKKGLVRLVTSKGPLSLELHCDLAPRTCENFLLLCRRGYYDGTLFHRSIRGFMLQGGDPTGTGRGGASAWGAAFADECHAKLSHDARGVLSMANAGPNSNGSQFFLTYKAAPHLDRKHSVFGRLVGGEAALAALEAVATDGSDRPREECRILRAEVFADPTAEVEEAAAPAAAAAAAAAAGPAGSGSKRSLPVPVPAPAASGGGGGGVGRYLPAARGQGGGSGGAAGGAAAPGEAAEGAAKRPRGAGAGGFNFSSW